MCLAHMLRCRHVFDVCKVRMPGYPDSALWAKMNRYFIGLWNVEVHGYRRGRLPCAKESVEVVPTSGCKPCCRRSKVIIVAPSSMDEPTKASWYISVTADSNCICTVTAIRPLRHDKLALGYVTKRIALR